MGVHLNFRVGDGDGDGDNMCGDGGGGGDGDREDGDGVGMGTISRGWGGDGVVSSSPCQSLVGTHYNSGALIPVCNFRSQFKDDTVGPSMLSENLISRHVH